jgi:hypothetical protein
MVRSLETAQVDFGPLLGRLYGCIQCALQKFWIQPPELKAEMRPTTAASLIHDFVRTELRREFPEGNGDDVRMMITKKNLFLVIIRDKYKIRVKKMRAGHRVSHVRTQSVMTFMRQGPQLELIDSPTNVILGYQPRSPAELLTSTVWIVCPNGEGSSHWTMEVLPDEGNSASVTSIGGMPPTGPTPNRVVAKQNPALDEGEEETQNADEKKRADGKNGDRVD